MVRTLSPSALPIVLSGPTASGKTALAIALARATGGEVVCADSRQIYCGLEIAAATPTTEERQGVPHHLFSSIAPTTESNAGDFAKAAAAIVDDIHARGKRALLVGGTGLYLRAFRYGMDDAPPRDEELRQKLESDILALGSKAMHARLVEVDAGAAATIHDNDAVRIVRALEIVALTGKKKSERQQRHDAVDHVLRDAVSLLLDAPLPLLEPRIEQRAAMMFELGIIPESELLRQRLGEGHRLLATLGTAEALGVADGILTVPEAVRQTALRTRQYARRQRTWFQKEKHWHRLDAFSPHVVEDALSILRQTR